MKHFFAFVFILFPLLGHAQEEDDFMAGRPGVTGSVDVLPKGRLQWETGLGYEYSKFDGLKESTWTLNSSSLRWGIGHQVELDFNIDGCYTKLEDTHFSGVSGMSVGAVVRLFDGWKALPVISFCGSMLLPGSKDSHYLPENIGSQMSIVFNNQLTEMLSLDYDLGLKWEDDPRAEVFWGAALTAQLTPVFGFLVEEYNTNHRDVTDCWMGLGAFARLNSRMQMDIGTNLNLKHMGKYHDVSIGLVWQLTK